jgi:hypothetical protein
MNGLGEIGKTIHDLVPVLDAYPFRESTAHLLAGRNCGADVAPGLGVLLKR